MMRPLARMAKIEQKTGERGGRLRVRPPRVRLPLWVAVSRWGMPANARSLADGFADVVGPCVGQLTIGPAGDAFGFAIDDEVDAFHDFVVCVA